MLFCARIHSWSERSNDSTTTTDRAIPWTPREGVCKGTAKMRSVQSASLVTTCTPERVRSVWDTALSISLARASVAVTASWILAENGEGELAARGKSTARGSGEWVSIAVFKG